MARRPCATRSPRRSRPSLTSCVDRSPGTKALRCHSTLNCGLTLAWLCTSVNLTARGSVAATRTPTACYVSTSRRAQISPDTPPTISLLSLPTSTAALARPSDGRPPPRRSTSIYYRFNQPALRRPLESALLSGAVARELVRHAVLPAAPHDAAPGASERADRALVIVPASDRPGVDRLRPGVPVTATVSKCAERVTQPLVARPAEASDLVLARLDRHGRLAGVA